MSSYEVPSKQDLFLRYAPGFLRSLRVNESLLKHAGQSDSVNAFLTSAMFGSARFAEPSLCSMSIRTREDIRMSLSSRVSYATECSQFLVRE